MVQSFPTRHARKYRKKADHSVTVEAAIVEEDNCSEISNWANGAQVVEEQHPLIHTDISEGLNVKTPEGMARASRGMVVLRYGNDFYVTTVSKLEQVYEPAP